MCVLVWYKATATLFTFLQLNSFWKTPFFKNYIEATYIISETVFKPHAIFQKQYVSNIGFWAENPYVSHGLNRALDGTCNPCAITSLCLSSKEAASYSAGFKYTRGILPNSVEQVSSARDRFWKKSSKKRIISTLEIRRFNYDQFVHMLYNLLDIVN